MRSENLRFWPTELLQKKENPYISCIIDSTTITITKATTINTNCTWTFKFNKWSRFGYQNSGLLLVLAFTISFQSPNLKAEYPLIGSILWRISLRGDSVALESVSHISKPSTTPKSWMSPPAKLYSVGSQSVTCIISMLTRPFVDSRGLCTKPAPRTPPDKQKVSLLLIKNWTKHEMSNFMVWWQHASSGTTGVPSSRLERKHAIFFMK